ncbi:MAPK regulated corepressor interacting protein 2 isoform X5 [Chrysemys picta bellii]|uniref:MAPK regulated corepressor interacting protein 2 isoform X5 n=1 Tax=Chrysemys picta bellii TaxID=8478 RepID=UPI001C677DBE|nr:MAPK regulated corepressor interacting protein 2 isoform X4 [Chrysemys picta bellii]
MMYTITRGPSKLATQRRTGPTQQVESKAADLKGRQPPHSAWPLSSSPTPKLVFNRVNGKRPPVTTQPTAATEESYTLAHEENVRFVYENFVPIDLEEWWAQQFLAKIENGS